MEKGKELADAEAERELLSILDAAGYNSASGLEKTLILYEVQAKLVLMNASYADENGVWQKGFDADALAAGDIIKSVGYFNTYEDLLPTVKGAVNVLANIRKCRENARLGNLQKAVLNMELIAGYYYSLVKGMHGGKGGESKKNQSGIKEAIAEQYDQGRRTASQIWKHFKLLSSKGKDYITASGVSIIYKFDPVDEKGRLYDGILGEFRDISFRTFQDYCTEVKKSRRK